MARSNREGAWPWKMIVVTTFAAVTSLAGYGWNSTLGVAQTKPQDAAKTADAAITALGRIKDYGSAIWHPLHFSPAIDSATNAQCLACHQEIMTKKVRPTSPAGLKAADAAAWYQTLDTYSGAQETFHARHLTTPYAKQVMDLNCNFCHRGHDPREEAPGSSATTENVGKVTLRKQVDPQATCLLCHGAFPKEFMAGIEEPWHKIRENFETPEQPNGCLTCHAEQFRTVRHQVSYLKADAIEAAAKTGADVCYGCHGGRAWYRTTYPYPRHPWPDMDKDVPDWAKNRPTKSDARYALEPKPAAKSEQPKKQ